jgi:hypothetical protein
LCPPVEPIGHFRNEPFACQAVELAPCLMAEDGPFGDWVFRSDEDVRRGVKISGSLAGAVVVLLMIYVAAEHVRGRWALNRRLKDLAAQSERLSVSAVEPKRPPIDQNGFAELAKVTNRLASVVRNIEPPPSLRFAAPGRAVVAWRLEEWTSDRGESRDWTEVALALDRERDLLAVLRGAVQKPAYDSGFDYSKGFVDFQIGQLATVKYAANLLSAATLNGLHTNQINTAFEDPIKAKMNGAQPVQVWPAAVSQVLNLAEALKQSVAVTANGKPGLPRPMAKSRKARAALAA